MKEKLSDNIRTVIIPLLVFSFVINLLVFTSPLYMMQIYDRVLSSRSEVTLVGLSVIVVFLMGLSCAFDAIRSRILVRAGLKFDEDIRMPLFDAVSEFERKFPRRNSVQYFRDKAVVEVLKDSVPEELARRIQPGMVADVVVSTEPRSVLSYLVRPLSDTMSRGFREE